MSNTIRGGRSINLNVQAGESLKVSTITGTYTATVLAGAGAGTALATESSGGATYGPYAAGVVICVKCSADGLADIDVGVSPALNYAEPARFGYGLDGDVSSLVDGAGNVLLAATHVTTSEGLRSIFASPIVGRVIYLGPQTYTMTSLMSVAMTSARIIGIPGLTKITGSFGYSVLQLLDVLDVEFYGVTFETTTENAVEDTGSGCLFSYRNSIIGLSFRRCTFQSPAANTNGLSFYPRINAGDAAATLDGLTITDCDFANCGRMGLIILNRFSGAGRDEFAKNVTIANNRFRNLGLSGTFGIAISLDGYGRSHTIKDNLFENCLGIGIENTGFNYSKFYNNSFRDFRSGRLWSPMSFSVPAGVKITSNAVVGNVCVDPANQRSNFIGVDDSGFSGNIWRATGDSAFSLRNADRNKVTRDRFISDSVSAATIGNNATTTTKNKFEDCVFDNTSYTAGASITVLFDGALTTANKIVGGNIYRGTSGSYVAETNGATWEGRQVAQDDLFVGGYRIINMSDANYTLSEFNAQCENLRFSGALTVGRTVFFPRVERKYLIANTTAYALTLSCNSVTVTVAAGAKRAVSWQETSGSWYDWGGLS